MARPKILTYRGDGELRSVNDSDFNGIANVVLEKFASELGPGSLTEVDSGSTTLIGTFTDTRYQGAVGTGDITLLTSTYNLYQNLNSSWTDVNTPPIVWNDNSINVADSDTLDTIGDEILNYMVTNEGPGCYQIAQSAPSGGTWQAMATFSDVLNTTTTNTYNLYKKISGDDPVTYRPVKNAGSGALQVMTEAETQQLEQRVRKRIVQTGVGQYALQATAPVTGTWSSKGTIIDTRPTTFVQNYNTDYLGERNYDGSVLQSFTAQYLTAYVGDYTGTVPVSYAGDRDVTYTGVVSQSFNAGYSTNFLGTTPANYLGTRDQNFTGIVSQNFLGTTPANYAGTRPANYDGTRPATYAGTRPANYAGTRPANYASSTINFAQFTGTYTGTSTVTYNRTIPTVFAVFTGNYAGTRVQQFTGPIPTWQFFFANFNGYVFAAYLRQPQFTGTTPGTFTGSYAGIRPAQYLNFTGVAPANFVGYYTGVRTTTTNFAGSTPGNFAGVAPGNFAGTPISQNFLGTTPANYLGTRSVNYLGPRESNFLGTTPANYLSTYTRSYAGTRDLGYVGIASQNFVGEQPVTYSTDYAAVYTTLYAGIRGATYTGPAVTIVSYQGSQINNDTSNITTLQLWRRIA